MFSREDRYRDTLIAGLALLALAALCVPVLVWLFRGLEGAARDLDTFQGRRTRENTEAVGSVLFAALAVVGTAAVGMAGLGVWFIVGGARRARGGRKRGRRGR